MPKKPTAADVLVDTLIDWGVDIVFGLPGDGINGIVEALRARQDRIRFVVARHEEAAAFMACAYAKWTGRLGCCLATTGPGGVHLLNGLYDAKFDRAPVLAITGLPYHDLSRPRRSRTSTTSGCSTTWPNTRRRSWAPPQVAQAVGAGLPHGAGQARGRAPRHADRRAGPGGRGGRAVAPQRRAGPSAARSRAGCPRADDVASGRRVLNAGREGRDPRRPGRLGARGRVARRGRLLGAPIAKALLGKAVLPDDHPLRHRRGRAISGPAVAAGLRASATRC